MQIVHHLGLPIDVGVQDIFGKLERHAHSVAVVVVRDVLAPIDEPGEKFLGMREVPFVDIDHAVAAVDFDDRSNQRDGAIANFLDVWAFIHGEPVGQLHQRGGRARFRRVNRARDVVDGHGLRDELVRFRVVEFDGTRIGQLGEASAILVEGFQIFFRGDGHGDHFAAFFGLPDGVDLHARGGLLQQAHVAVDILGVRQDSRRA